LGEWLCDPVTPLFETWLLERVECGLHDWIRRTTGVRLQPPYHLVVNGWYFYSMNFAPKSLGAMLRLVAPAIPKMLAQPRRALGVESGEAAELRSRRLKEARLAAEARARAALQSHRKARRQFETALAGAQRLQPLREEQALDFTLGWPVLRRAVAILANELVQR